MLAARSKALRVHARQGRDLGRVFFLCVNLLLLGKFALVLPGLTWTATQLGTRGAELSPKLQCAWIFAPLWGPTAMLWLLG